MTLRLVNQYFDSRVASFYDICAGGNFYAASARHCRCGNRCAAKVVDCYRFTAFVVDDYASVGSCYQALCCVFNTLDSRGHGHFNFVGVDRFSAVIYGRNTVTVGLACGDISVGVCGFGQRPVVEFDAVAEQAAQFLQKARVLFALSSFDNLVKNGRMGRVTGVVARALGMNVLGLTLAANESGAPAVSHETVLAEAEKHAEDFERLVRGVLRLL